MQNVYFSRPVAEGPLGPKTAPECPMTQLQSQESIQWSVLFQIPSVQRIFPLKAWPEMNAPGGEALTPALRASCMNSGVPHTTLPNHAHCSSIGSWPSANLSSQLPHHFLAMWPGTSSLRSLCFVRESNTSEYHWEINEMAEIKTLAPNFQTNTTS